MYRLVKAVWHASSAATLCMAIGLPGASGLAQEAQPRAIDPAQLVPACLQGTWRPVAQVPEDKRGKKFPIVVAERDVKALEAAGFERTECKTSDLASAPKRTAWRDAICELAAHGNEAVQNQLERALGAAPAALCGSAELALGAWQPKAKGKPGK